MPDNQINSKDIIRYKKLLRDINLQSVLNDNLKPLIVGYLIEAFKGSEYSRPLIFAYKDEIGKIMFIEIEDNDTIKGSTCLVFRRNEYGGYPYCRKSDEDAFKKLFDCKIITEMDKTFTRIDNNPAHIGYCYQCSVMKLKEWIIPLFINNTCVGAFISGRFYSGDSETFAENLHATLSINCSDMASKFTVDIIKDCDIPMPEPEQSETDRLFKKVAIMQESVQKNYENELARYEKLVLGHIISIVDGKNSEQSYDNKNIQERLEYSRDLLCKSMKVLSDIFDLKESIVFTSDIKRNDKSSHLFGLDLNRSDGINNLVTSTKCLNVEMIKTKLTDSNDNGLFVHLIIRDGDCQNLFVESEISDIEKYSNCILMIVAARSNMDYPMAFFISFNNENEKINTDHIISFLEHLSTAFLAQWNMLLAEQSQEDATNNIMYIRHEVREALSAQDGILRKIETRYRKTLLRGARNTSECIPELPPAVSEFLDYMKNIFFNDYSATIQILHDIIDNYNILTEDLELSYKNYYNTNKMLKAIPPIFKHMQEFGARWLEKSPGWENPVPNSIDIDPGKINQALRNLVRNAQKYGYDSTNILLDYGCDEDITENVFFTITSFGAEIPEEERDMIFERGYRGKQHIGEQETGRGLGLYVARKIAELHGGTLVLVCSKEESTLNIPLLLEYTKKYDAYISTNKKEIMIAKGFREDVYNKCIKEIENLGNDKLFGFIYQPEKNQEEKQNLIIVREHKNRFLINEITQPTYRNTFKLSIPKKKKESKNDTICR